MRHSSLALLIGLFATVACGAEDDPPTTANALRPPPNGAQSGSIPEICWRERLASLDQIASVRQQYLDCTLDDDCVMANASTGCDITCPTTVNRHGMPALAHTVAAVEHAYCEDYRARSCPPSIALCAYAQARCVATRCAMVVWRLQPL